MLGHHFNVKPAEIVRSGDRVTADGQISHRLSFGPDDQFHYHIEKTGDVVDKRTMTVVRGGVASLLALWLVQNGWFC